MIEKNLPLVIRKVGNGFFVRADAPRTVVDDSDILVFSCDDALAVFLKGHFSAPGEAEDPVVLGERVAQREERTVCLKHLREDLANVKAGLTFADRCLEHPRPHLGLTKRHIDAALQYVAAATTRAKQL